MRKFIVIASISIMSVQFLSAQQNEFSWLVGTWQLKDKNVYEVWKIADGGKELEGVSFRIRNSDTTITEKIRLTYDGDAFHYIPDVAGDQPPVDFKITTHTSASFAAENPLHDFPKVIRYQFVRKDNKQFIEATIEGNGKVIAYSFERVK
jgi:hypothetical protein